MHNAVNCSQRQVSCCMPDPVSVVDSCKHQQERRPCQHANPVCTHASFARTSCLFDLCSHFADGTVLLYDPRKLTSPWDQTACSGSHVIKDLHWQHTSSSKSSHTAVKGSSQDSHIARSSSDQNDATASAVSLQAHAASVFATPAPAAHLAVSHPAFLHQANIEKGISCLSCTAVMLELYSCPSICAGAWGGGQGGGERGGRQGN